MRPHRCTTDCFSWLLIYSRPVRILSLCHRRTEGTKRNSLLLHDRGSNYVRTTKVDDDQQWTITRARWASRPFHRTWTFQAGPSRDRESQAMPRWSNANCQISRANKDVRHESFNHPNHVCWPQSPLLGRRWNSIKELLEYQYFWMFVSGSCDDPEDYYNPAPHKSRYDEDNTSSRAGVFSPCRTLCFLA